MEPQTARHWHITSPQSCAGHLRRRVQLCGTATVRDGNGNTYFPVDGFVIWQAAELLEGHLSLSDQHI